MNETIRRICELQRINAQRAAVRRNEREKQLQAELEEQRIESANRKREQKEMYREDLRLRFKYLNRSWAAQSKPVLKKSSVNIEQVISLRLPSAF